MKLDKERFFQDLEEWHESHLDYYANFVERIKEDGHKGLSGMMNVMSEFYPNTQSPIRDGMNNPSKDLSSAIERVKSSGFTEEMVVRFQDGDDHAAAALYFIMIGGGLIIMFTIAYDLWHDKKLSLKSLGLSRLLLSKICKRLIKASMAAGYDTVGDWRETINVIYEGQDNKLQSKQKCKYKRMRKRYAPIYWRQMFWSAKDLNSNSPSNTYSELWVVAMTRTENGRLVMGLITMMMERD